MWKTNIPTSSRRKVASIPFKDYAPQVFRRIRNHFGVPDREYMLSLGPEQILGELLLVRRAARPFLPATPRRLLAATPPSPALARPRPP